MGHGDQLAVVDRNFPANSQGVPVVELGEVTIERAMRAILSVFPLDTFVEHPFERMEADGDPSVVNECHTSALEVARAHHDQPVEYGVIPRFDFYERASHAYAVVRTLETQPYGCFLLTKGVI